MEQTKIQWTDDTWNPFHGCHKVSEGCKYCYMYRDKERYGKDPNVVMKSKTGFYAPLKWKEPRLIFTCSWSDWFIEEADQWRDELWEIIKSTPHHTYQILTKRPERIKQCLPADWGQGYDNVWLGVSVENNKNLDRCMILGEIPAKVKFISAEPLLGELPGLNEIFSKFKFDWCIIGGESGNSTGKYLYRECKLEWIVDIIKTCKEKNVKVFVKQTGTFLKKQLNLKDSHGGKIEEWPEELKIREFPDKKTSSTLSTVVSNDEPKVKSKSLSKELSGATLNTGSKANRTVTSEKSSLDLAKEIKKIETEETFHKVTYVYEYVPTINKNPMNTSVSIIINNK